jgi:two-component system, chemotaxis family, CheB/CheR fusion protein
MADTAAEPARHLVVIGASAGGIEALSMLVSTLPADLLAPIVIAQHLDPTRLSHLHDILGRKSTLPVRTVQNTESLQPGVVYVVPADRQVEITDHAVTVHAEATHGRPSPSIDRLLETAAEVFGEQLIAVVLTGLGSDGADGARRVKELGGTVVIQNPQTATHPEMPLSLAPTIVDVVAELEAIGPLLNELLNGTYAPVNPDDDRRLRTLLERVRTRSGIDFSAYREPTIRRRLQRRMLDTGSATLDDYTVYLRRHPQEYDRLANSFLIKVTDFFRDADLFDYLGQALLPRVIEEARRSQRTELRIWSAGCATGEEAYSMAILLSELLSDAEDLAVRVFATDVDADAVTFGRRGVYPSSAVGNLSGELREKYLNLVESAYEVRKNIRAMVIFGQHDLGQRAPFPHIDLVLCRNVLIYFTPELQRRALQLFAFGLRDGGYLVLGKSETSSPLAEHFTLVDPRLKVFRRQGERVLIPPARIRDSSPVTLGAGQVGRLSYGAEREFARGPVRVVGPTTAERAEEALLDLPIGVAVVDRQYDIQSINVAARRLLGIHTPAIGDDIVHLAHRGLGESLRDAIDAALRGEQFRSVREVSSLPEAPGETRHFELITLLERSADGRPEPVDAVVLLISDVTERELALREATRLHAEAESRAARVQALLDESTRTVRQLLQANQELSVTNAGLRSANEELLVGHEEAQAAMEEIETLNEEQQATNEELETLNEELQATVEELNATNEDLQSRSVELQEQATARDELLTSLAKERQRLNAVLASMAEAVLVVNPAAETVLTNATFQHWFGERLPSLEDASGRQLPARNDPAHQAARGETFMQPFTAQAADGERRWFEATGQPIRTGDTVEGGVVVIRDVSDRSLRHLQEEFVAMAGHELRTPLAAMRGSLQLLERVLGDDAGERVRRYLRIGAEQIELLTSLVQDLTDLVRVQTGQLPIVRAPVDVVELAQTTVELARPMAEDRAIELKVPNEPIVIDGDRRRLQQVLLNLIANAVQHGASAAGTQVHVNSERGLAVICVRDHGSGIAADDRGRVFERFYQTERGIAPGLGVGLYLTHAIVTAHGGTIGVDPTEGGGTTFTVRLPRAIAGAGVA